MIDEINETRDEHIMTIEDPIEFLHRHKKCMVNQREVGADTKSFNRALKSVLRQDPDIILVGEMRDTETMADGPDRRRDRPPRVRHAAHPGRAADHRPHHRRLPAAPAGADPRAALHDADGRLHAAAAADARRPRPLRRLRAAHPDAGGPQPHPRGQDAPDLLHHADRHRSSACRPWTRRSPTWCAAASSRRELAKNRSSTPAEFERLLGQPAAAAAGRGERCRNHGSGR